MSQSIRPMMIMAAAVMAGQAIGVVDSPKVRVMDCDERSYPTRASAPAGGRKYKPNGKREIERRLRQMESRSR